MRRLSEMAVVACALFLLVEPAFAEQAAQAASGGLDLSRLAACFGIAVAAFGGALGQGRTASSALEGISRNPGASGQLFTPMLLGLALIETLVLFTFLICAKGVLF